MTEIKDIYEGDTVRIKGKIYKVKIIDKSPWIIQKGIDIFNFELEYVEDDFGEMLADLVESERKL